MRPVPENETHRLLDALEDTDRRLRRILRALRDDADLEGDEFQLELRRARRRVRENRDILSGPS